MERNKLGQFEKGHTFFFGKKRPNISRENNYNWKGGKIIQNGYVYVLCPDHPRAKSKKGYVAEHTLVMEKKIRRYLKQGKGGECVHHIDEKKKNNNIKNLMLFKNSVKHHEFRRMMKNN